MRAYHLGHRIGTFHLCDILKFRFWRKIFRTEKRKCAHTVLGIGWYRSHLPFTWATSRNWDIEKNFFGQKSKKFFLEKKSKIFLDKNENTRKLFREPGWYRWHLLFTCATSRNRDIEETFFGPKNKNVLLLFRAPGWYLSLVRPPEIDIFKEIFRTVKTKMRAYCSRNRDGTVDTSLSSERTSKIEISKKFFWTEKRKSVHTIQGIGLVPLISSFHLYDLQKSRCRSYFIGPKIEKARILFRASGWYLSPVRPPKIEILKENF